LRGFGCTVQPEVAVPAIIRSSAGGRREKVERRRRRRRRRKRGNKFRGCDEG